MFLQERYELEDCVRYDTTSYNLPPNSSITQISDVTFSNTGDWEISWTHNFPRNSARNVLYKSTDNGVFLGIGVSGGTNEYVYWTGHESGHSSYSLNTDYNIKIIKENGVFKVYSRGNLLDTVPYNDLLNAPNINLGLRNWGSGTGTIKNIKIKAL